MCSEDPFWAIYEKCDTDFDFYGLWQKLESYKLLLQHLDDGMIEIACKSPRKRFLDHYRITLDEFFTKINQFIKKRKVGDIFFINWWRNCREATMLCFFTWIKKDILEHDYSFLGIVTKLDTIIPLFTEHFYSLVKQNRGIALVMELRKYVEPYPWDKFVLGKAKFEFCPSILGLPNAKAKELDKDLLYYVYKKKLDKCTFFYHEEFVKYCEKSFDLIRCQQNDRLNK
jgi:hypothetical protein